MTTNARLARRDNPDAVQSSARRLTTPRVALVPKSRFANCSPSPQELERQQVLREPDRHEAHERERRVDRNSWYAGAAAWVLTSSAWERAPMARTSASDRDCAEVAILGSMARGAS